VLLWYFYATFSQDRDSVENNDWIGIVPAYCINGLYALEFWIVTRKLVGSLAISVVKIIDYFLGWLLIHPLYLGYLKTPLQLR
jgi:hypothetical protein